MSSWIAKFTHAFRGLGRGLFDHSLNPRNSFWIHLPAAAIVLSLAWAYQLDTLRICVLVLCIALVFVAELFNTSIECLARAITKDQNSEIGAALDIASGAVLATALFAVVVGALVFWL